MDFNFLQATKANKDGLNLFRAKNSRNMNLIFCDIKKLKRQGFDIYELKQTQKP